MTKQNREVLARWHNADGGRLKLDASIHAEYTSFPALWRDFAAFARENGLNMHVHLSETRTEHENCVEKYGKTPAAVLAENGVFDVRTTAAHCVWITDEDMDILAEKGVTAASYMEIPGAGAAEPPEEIIDFILDRPFLFVITNRYDLPLFAGVVNQPQ